MMVGEDSTLNRFIRKRNSHDLVRSHHSSKNSKKPVPGVVIDLKQHNNLTLGTNNSRNNTQNHLYDETRRIKAQNPLLNMHTQLLRQPNVLSEYREEIQQLRLQNEQLKLQNQQIKDQNSQTRVNEMYIQRQLKQVQSQVTKKDANMRENKRLYERKLKQYVHKIKQLYEQLIQEKKRNQGIQHKIQYESQILSHKPKVGNSHNRGPKSSFDWSAKQWDNQSSFSHEHGLNLEEWQRNCRAKMSAIELQAEEKCYKSMSKARQKKEGSINHYNRQDSTFKIHELSQAIY